MPRIIILSIVGQFINLRRRIPADNARAGSAASRPPPNGKSGTYRTRSRLAGFLGFFILLSQFPEDDGQQKRAKNDSRKNTDQNDIKFGAHNTSPCHTVIRNEFLYQQSIVTRRVMDESTR
jgi:hypothetical protein